MIEVLRQQLPAGLAKFAAGCDEWTQRPNYEKVSQRVNKPSVTTAPRKDAKKASAIIPHIVREIDELYDIYNDQMKADTNKRFLASAKEFVGKTPGRELVGRKSSREIIAFVSAPHMYANPPDSFYKLCSYLLNARIYISSRDEPYEWNGIDIVKTLRITH
jgi:hypothetical protein